MMLDDNKLGYILVISAMLIWGSIGLLVRMIPYSAEIIVFYRVLFAFIFLLIIRINQKKRINIKGQNKVILVISGVALALNWILFFQAVKSTTIASATLSYYTSPIIVVILSVIFLKERLTGRELIALILGVLGIVSMLVIPADSDISSNIGVIYGLLAACCYAIFTLASKVINSINIRDLTLIQTGICIIILAPFALTKVLPEEKSLILLIVLGIIHTALALMMYNKGLRLTKVHNVGTLSYLDPLSAILWAFLFLGEIPSPISFVGGVLILSSSYLVVKDV